MIEYAGTIAPESLDSMAIKVAGWLAEQGVLDVAILEDDVFRPLEVRKTNLPGVLVQRVLDRGAAEIQWSAGAATLRLEPAAWHFRSSAEHLAAAFALRFTHTL